jgi:cellulose synthase/poly-beta-1,6-N-acetylglucosamine synthase-like glycosyltransferase
MTMSSLSATSESRPIVAELTPSADDPQIAAPPPLLLLLPVAAGLIAATVLFTYVPYRFLLWGAEVARDSHMGWVLGAWPVALAGISALAGLRWCFLLVVSFAAYCRNVRRGRPAVRHWPKVSVFVPAYNESETIEAALLCLTKLNYPDYEVIVVDDGSTDGTDRLARRFEGEHGRCTIRVFRKPNGGKWSAHNFAFRHSRGELIVCLDADSRIDPDALWRLVCRMADPNVDAVAGQIRVRNRENLLTRLQALEYVMANGALRMAQSYRATVLLIPGPIGMFRRSVMEDVLLRFGKSDDSPSPGAILGPFEGDTFAEDFDVSAAIIGLGGRIEYEPEAVSHTKAPDSLFALLNQRYRWCRGTIQVLRKCFRRGRREPDLLHSRFVFWVTATYLLDLLMLPAIYLTTIVLLAVFLATTQTVLPLLFWFGAFMSLNLNAAALFLAMHRDRLSLLAALPLYDFYQGFLLNAGWAMALFDEIRGAKMRW